MPAAPGADRTVAVVSASPPSFYELLGVDRDADTTTIHKAFRSLSKVTHPDVGGNAGLFRMITDAHATLTDSAARADYDARLASGEQDAPAQHRTSATGTTAPDAGTVDPSAVAAAAAAMLRQQHLERLAAQQHAADAELDAVKRFRRYRAATATAAGVVVVVWWWLRASGATTALFGDPAPSELAATIASVCAQLPALVALLAAAAVAGTAEHWFPHVLLAWRPLLGTPRALRWGVASVIVAVVLFAEYVTVPIAWAAMVAVVAPVTAAGAILDRHGPLAS